MPSLQFLAWKWFPGLLVVWMSCLGIARPDDAADPLERQIAGGWTYDSFNAATRQIEQRTGLQVACPKELSAFMQTIWMKQTMPAPAATTSVRTYLDRFCDDLSLRWRFEPMDNAVSVEPAWKTADPRTPAELFKAVWQPDGGDDPKWQAAFDALLSQEVNYDKAWKVRQKSVFQSVFRFLYYRPSKPVLMKDITDAEGSRYALIITCQPIEMHPGHGSVSYYWFGNDGVLIGAGLMNTGHRCRLVEVTVGKRSGQNAGQPSELQMSLEFNTGIFYLARFVLDKEALRMTRLSDASKEVASFNDIGRSLLEPDQP